MSRCPEVRGTQRSAQPQVKMSISAVLQMLLANMCKGSSRKRKQFGTFIDCIGMSVSFGLWWMKLAISKPLQRSIRILVKNLQQTCSMAELTTSRTFQINNTAYVLLRLCQEGSNCRQPAIQETVHRDLVICDDPGAIFGLTLSEALFNQQKLLLHSFF